MSETSPQFGCGDFLPGSFDGGNPSGTPDPPGPGTNEPGVSVTAIGGGFEPGDPVVPDDSGGGPPVPGPPTPVRPSPPDTGGGGGGGGAAPRPDPGGTAGGVIFDPITDPGGPNAAGGFGGFDFDGPDLPGNLGGSQTGIDTGGDIFTPPDAAGGLGAFDFDGPDPPGNLGGSQTGIDFGGDIFTPPDAAGGFGGFDFDGPDLPGNLGGFQTGIDTGLGGPNTQIDAPGGTAGGGLVDPGDVTDVTAIPGTNPGGIAPGGGLFDPGSGSNTDATPINQAFKSEENSINLNDFNNRIASDQTFNLLDEDIALRGGRNFSKNKFVTNSFGRLDIFQRKIADPLLYILKNNNKFQDWSANAIYALTTRNILFSLNSDFLNILRSIKKIDGSLFTDEEVAQIVLTKVLEGNVSDLVVSEYADLAKKTNSSKKTIIPSSDQDVNTAAAIRLVDLNKIPLDPNANHILSSNRYLIETYKTFATDLAKHLKITVDGVDYKYYISDDDTFIDRSTLQIEDGDYFICRAGGVEHRLPVDSEKDHGFIIDETTRQRALKLLGGTPIRTLAVSASISDNVEFDNSLSAPRLNAYILKLDTSSINTTTVRNYVKETNVSYTLLDSSSTEGIREINKYIRYKSNYEEFTLADDDLIFDYIEQTSSISLRQQDVVIDAAKTNKLVPLLVRQVPWYIVVMPTNRTDLLTFGSKSRIVNISDDNIITRELDTVPAINPALRESKYQSYIETPFGYDNDVTDIRGDFGTQVRYKQFNPNNNFYDNKYVRVENNEVVESSAKDSVVVRKKTGFRLMKEILEELKNNYVIDDEGSTKGVNAFDLVSRLSLTEFNKLSALENLETIVQRVKEGVFSDIKIFPSLARAGLQAARKTRLVQRRAGAAEDNFPSVKAKNDGEYVVPPTTEARSSTFSVQPLDDLVAKCTRSRGPEPL